ncbi:Fpg/Nei family DNA glycosylase [Egicoccus halophilus]|uniref:DNA-(apurinic or apyrimidinic site) lyase n=1 Tax=Egicoccus halophilus TaxID=1670830 RepID=A0A8J3AAW1_9ACTN|nr:DNA-formamidopyrimidine glycosylase family protein [Egicoccus halophilus]GGI09541.1 putative endonuclease 8 2 [Egicoccus halophilus]
MPEGDTIHRTAAALRPVLVGKPLTRVEVPRVRPPLPAIGATVERVEARGKHLLITTSDGLVVHTHQRMTGSWHVYRPGERWRKSPRAARVVLAVPGAVAVCFAAPVVEILDQSGLRRHPALRRLGPDLCDPAPDLDEVRQRVARQDPSRAIGEVLLDQTVACGIGNVYRCDVAFLHGVDPHAVLGTVPDTVVDALFATAGRLLRANLDAAERTTVTGAPPGTLWVYGRGAQPCRRCGIPVASGHLGEQQRLVYWCPLCQPSGATGTVTVQDAGADDTVG